MKRTRPQVQASEVTYELHSLGWKAFQNLCSTITSEILGQTVQGFFDSHDGGRDGAFYGSWQSKSGEIFEGSFAVQCKFTAKPAHQIHLTDLKDELAKAERLAKKGKADNYFLFTNARLTGAEEEVMSAAFKVLPGIKTFTAFGCEKISRFIHESSRLRMLVPRVYGLGDLSQILDERAYAQAREILNSMGDDLRKVVITEAYRKSAQAIIEHGFVLLLGEPACGKSTIAAMLAMGALDKWGCSVIKVRNANDFVEHSNPNEGNQFFCVDDAFGSTQLDYNCISEWNRTFSYILAAIHRGSKILFTSRDYIYNYACGYLKVGAFPLITKSQVVIHVEELKKEEREQILYNHLRLGSQPKEFKSKIKPFLPFISTHRRFNPEIARRLGLSCFSRGLELSKESLDSFVTHQSEFLCETIKTLDVESRSALALIFMNAGNLPSPINISYEEEKAIECLGGTKAGIIKSLKALDGSFLLRNNSSWQFKHPTIRDAFATLTADDPELLGIYLRGAPIKKILEEVTCGTVCGQGAKVTVPPDHYDLIISRILSFHAKDWREEAILPNFICYRCDKVFLVRILDLIPNFINNLDLGPYSYMSSNKNIDIFVRLKELELLPDNTRLKVVRKAREWAIETPDADFLDEKYRILFEEEELLSILTQVFEKLIPELDDVIDNWRHSYDGKIEPYTYFELLKDALEKYRVVFQQRNLDFSALDQALTNIRQVIDDLEAEYNNSTSVRDLDDYYDRRREEERESIRSIFDDVDQ